ncbi:hypothetical protein GF351_01520 [Candidatus Woesearchaeota archaeon]|nr:hypothetical protein [Candidatus Woesearchaeota archaeon]
MQTAVLPQPTPDPTLNVAIDTINKKKQALVFVNTKRSAEKTAEELSKRIKTSDPALKEISEKVLKALPRPTAQCERLARCVKKGVAFHHAGLTHKQKELVEENFKLKVIKVICATPTLAMGVDLPAFRSIIRDLRRFGHRGMQFIPVLEYLQMAGRAGRPKFDSWGEAICIAKSEGEKDKIKEMYIEGEPEDIYSKLAVEPVLRTYLLSLVASGFVCTEKQVFDFFKRTFWAYQFEDFSKIEAIIERMLHLLEQWRFIKGSKQEDSDFVSANQIRDGRYRATVLGKRVAELYIDPLTAHNMIEALERAGSSRSINEFSYLHMICYTLEMRPLLSVRTKEWDDIQERLIQYETYFIEPEPSMYEPEYDDFVKAVKTTFMFMDWIDEKDEEFILEHYSARPGELRIKLSIADWLLYAADELCRILNLKAQIREIRKLRLRVKAGAREELLPLLRLEGIGRVRARKLFNNKIRAIKDVKEARLPTLTQLLGSKTALKVKEQVDETVKPVKKGKRKGQVSLKKF